MVNILLGIHSLAPVGVSRGGIVIDRLLDLSSLKLAENCGQHPLELRQVLVVQHWLYDDLKKVNIPNVKCGKKKYVRVKADISKLTNRWLCGGCRDLLHIERIGRAELAVALSGAVLVLQSRELVRAQELIRCRPRRQLLLLLLLVETVKASIERLLLLVETVEASIELLQKIPPSFSEISDFDRSPPVELPLHKSFITEERFVII